MQHNIFETRGPHRDLVASAEDFNAAIALARTRFKIAFLERDEEHTGCADFMTSDGLIGCIEPEGFKLPPAA